MKITGEYEKLADSLLSAAKLDGKLKNGPDQDEVWIIFPHTTIKLKDWWELTNEGRESALKAAIHLAEIMRGGDSE